MMISQPALLCLEATVHRLVRGAATDRLPDAARPSDLVVVATSRVESETQSAAPVARPEGPSAERAAAPADLEAPLTPNELRARAAALRALALSRGRRFEAARVAFTEAARLDPALDLTRTPAFWKLERAAHEAAIAAYVATGRDRDAAVLRARVNSTFRPRPLKPRQSAPATS
jgi:hypothetical protein